MSTLALTHSVAAQPSAWSRLSLKYKLLFPIQGAIFVVAMVCQYFIVGYIERNQMDAAEHRLHVVADTVLNCLNTLMSANVGGKDVISDEKTRLLFINKLASSEFLTELRVMRSQQVNGEFGKGAAQEEAVDEIDRQVMASGKLYEGNQVNAQGQTLFRTVMPYVAYKDFRGSRCLECHAANEGEVLGAISLTSDITADVAMVRQTRIWFWVGQVALQLTLFVLIVTVVRRQLRILGAEPMEAMQLAHNVASGDLSHRAAAGQVPPGSLMASLVEMQDGLSDIVRNVRQGAEGIALSSTEIAQGNQDLSQRTEHQAQDLQHAASLMDELRGKAERNAASAASGNSQIGSALGLTKDGGAVVQRFVATMRGISEASQKISPIIGLIDSIAFQTNILALNAAVEAARAGEQGRGFAVVASEVRALAGRSAQAAREINELIQGSQREVEQGVHLADDAGRKMAEITQSIGQVTETINQIAADSAEQSQRMVFLNETLTKIDQSTQQNAAMVEQIAAAAGSLNALSRELVAMVDRFRLQVS